MELLTQAWFRPSLFFGLLFFFLILEIAIPRRQQKAPKAKRWFANLALSSFNSIIMKLIVPAGLVSLTLKVQALNFGLFNILNLPVWIELILAIVLLDLFIYLQHLASHLIPIFWSLHKVHHADIELDASSGSRFHTIEILLSFLFKSLLILILGPSAIAVVLFEIILSSMAIFNHSNFMLPKVIDKYLRLIIVTPDMHRVHHSTKKHEHNKNFGFNLSIWDKIFKTYKPKPEDGQINMQIGLKSFRDKKFISFFELVVMPFKKY